MAPTAPEAVASAVGGSASRHLDSPGDGTSVALRFSPVPEHVRTARLVATAVARRLGLHDEQLDAIRLAVGEACARAVQRAETAGVVDLVALELTHRPAGSGVRLEALVVDGAGDDGVESEDVAMLLMEGLADEVHVGSGPGGPGGTARLVWTSLATSD